MKINGEKYKISSGVIIAVKHDLPIVGVMRDIRLVNGDKVKFHVDEYSTSFEPHFRAYVLDKSPLSSSYSNLFIQCPVFIHTSCILELSCSFIILPFALVNP